MRWPTCALVISGIFFRLLSVTGALGSIDPDEAVTGLIARHLAHGSFSAFYWGQAYGGTPDSVLLAPFVSIAPGNPGAIRATALLAAPTIAILIWRILLRAVSPPTAAFAAAISFSFPPFAVYFSTKAELFYNPIVVLGLAILLLSLRIKEHPADWRNWIGWGLAAGLGWWVGPAIVIYIVAGVLWLLWQARSRALLRTLPLAIVGFVVGALPWLIENVGRGYPSLKNPPLVGSYAEHTRIFLEGGVPTVFGLRLIPSQSWVVAAYVGAFVAVGLSLLFVVASVELLRRANPMILVIVPGVLFIIFVPLSFTVSNGRYLYYIAPLIVAAMATLFRKIRSQAVVAVACILLGVVWFNQEGAFRSGASHTLASLTRGANADDRDVIRHLEAIGATRLYSDYWVGGYKYVYLSDQRVIVTPFVTVRNNAYEDDVRRAPTPSYLFLATSARVPWMEETLQRRGIPYSKITIDGLVVFTPHKHVVVEDLVPNRSLLSESEPASRLPPP